MRLSLIDLLVSLASGAEARFEFLYEPKNQTLLLIACTLAERAFETLFGFGEVFVSNFFGLHNLLLSKHNPAINFGNNTGELSLCKNCYFLPIDGFLRLVLCF